MLCWLSRKQECFAGFTENKECFAGFVSLAQGSKVDEQLVWQEWASGT
jgi:hypothetical protein